ncbi:MAG TPA: CmcI family methyltransferase [Candidatus Sulfotelmatobacter sp.]|nr:CmcI family methyltransferase [Candidatus Sulfotelmatobacter sp.]
MTPPRSPNDPRNPDLLRAMREDRAVGDARHTLMAKGFEYGYHRNFEWLGIPIIQWPQDVLALVEILWEVKPTLVVETGVAFGGALVLYASILRLAGIEPQVVGVELAMRDANRARLNAHPLAAGITILDGSSTDPAIVAQVAARARDSARTLVILDSHHTHEHVAEELDLYAPFVTPGSYLIVYGTSVADLPADLALNRPWGPERNPGTALADWLPKHPEFAVARDVDDRLVLSDAPGGYLRRLR